MKVALRSEVGKLLRFGIALDLGCPMAKSATVIYGHHFALAALHLTPIFLWRMGKSWVHLAHHHGSELKNQKTSARWGLLGLLCLWKPFLGAGWVLTMVRPGCDLLQLCLRCSQLVPGASRDSTTLRRCGELCQLSERPMLCQCCANAALAGCCG